MQAYISLVRWLLSYYTGWNFINSHNMDSLIHTRSLTLKKVTACLILWPQSWELRAALLVLGIGTDNRESLRNRKQHAGILLLNAPWQLYHLHHCCSYTCFRTSWAWNKDAAPLYCVQHRTEDAGMWQCTPDTWPSLHDWACKRMLASLTVWNLKVHMQGTSGYI